MSKYEGADCYTYPNSDVLKNKLAIQDQAELDIAEANFTAIRLFELTRNPIAGNYDLTHLQAVHKYIFQDVYDWAGQFRTVDISKGNSRFCSWQHINRYLEKELNNIAKDSFLKNLPPKIFIHKLAHYLSEINAAHPFREGNGRSQRAFCYQLAFEAGYSIEFELATRDEMIGAMIASFHGDQDTLETLLDRITSQLIP
ncbi:Fic/DOC family protein [Parachitinimonas caeni]|uniref:protein adenylyltransferase n=1 Tax=Parachitinimonas caeni TaxID=3031301 RepID=A0ABT7DRP1_9NEIS|nr:Fic family protein [Parachitinimonas caeni]MDK2122737.1 Fic family protein [Parachitinimonas caeni]